MAEALANKKILLVKRPKGLPAKDDFKMVEGTVPEPKTGEVLVRTLYLSVDPYMRGRMNDQKSYVPPYPLNEVITGGVIGEVIQSRASELDEGDLVIGNYGWQTMQTVDSAQLRKIDETIAPVTTALGILGMTGLTAYFGLLDIGRPKPGETVVVSGAAGAVGMTVGQIAKIKGCRVVGIAGSDRKIQYLLDELGFDAAINYKTTKELKKALAEACPEGVDIYFDNVGGEISDAVMRLLNPHARIPVCGQISLYNLEKADIGPRIQPLLLINKALMKGFIVSDYAARFDEGTNQLAEWLKQGKLKYEENIVEGFENTIDAFLGLFKGENLGKQLVKVAEPSKRPVKE
ncbi:MULTISPECIES: NADP-dependent oxidoreductase [Thermoactinomyces]|uniref:NADP-dependent oxidoreductase n=1 Tax=Thermoactinomyces daqus TaxID=1329516 RepID=A0A7W1X7R2_9BACL|nr:MULTISPECIES: NADP-dependent oxidoreductase [Thermoactinomyces]MBA4541653.1 NADP-dependent oxidoreductase [Thermoactinomyces daqus]MBH8597650.1 NADP-dependent oxidoreductase [Thermoactinomyces sp. CICC 10523]MBH8603991.1 NADP-dependent oxidoreductase [Thermoactinomyces sp. CICC 10522]MBH8606475.1 NADP-dependent oxidoreductase [Thermoactinomyces sp. CICC 10521]